MAEDRYPAEPSLRPGDVLLYSGTGAVARLIRIKTWSNVSHAELYVGDGRTVTARIWGGVDYYPLALPGLRYVYRLTHQRWHRDRALAMFEAHMRGQRYDLIGLLLVFYAVRQGRENQAAHCSETVTRVLRWGLVEPFATDFDADAVAPAQFMQTPAFTRSWDAAIAAM